MDTSMFDHKKVIIFDMDGTLIDSVGVWNEVDAALIRHLQDNHSPTPEGNPKETFCCPDPAVIQQQRDRLLRRFSQTPSPYLEYCACLGKLCGSSLSPEKIHTLRYDIAHDYLINVIDYKKDADLFIRKLKAAGYLLVIATTTRRSNMDIYRTLNHNIRQKANLDDFFTLIYTREDARELKPHPEIYLRVLKELNVTPRECLVFEDSLIGIEAAKNAGIPSVAVYDPYSDEDRPRINDLSDYQIDSYSQLL